MPFTLTEKCLKITQINGNKCYGGEIGYTHVIDLSRVVYTRSVNRESTTGGPSGIPTSQLMGQQPDQIRLEISWTYQRLQQLINELIAYRVVSNAANIFLVGSILTKNGDFVDEMPNDTKWVVDTFTIRRSITRRGMAIGDLTLIRWYRTDV